MKGRLRKLLLSEELAVLFIALGIFGMLMSIGFLSFPMFLVSLLSFVVGINSVEMIRKENERRRKIRRTRERIEDKERETDTEKFWEKEREKLLRETEKHTDSPQSEISNLERSFPLVHSATGGRRAEARRFTNEGVDQFNDGEYESALKSLKSASERIPRDESIWAAMVPLHLTLDNCTQAQLVCEKVNSIDKESLPAKLATALYNYKCELVKSGSSLPDLHSQKYDRNLPPILVVPVDGMLIKVEFGSVPMSARKWWGEGIRSLKLGKNNLARTMFQAAIFEYKEFPHAWIGLASALRHLRFMNKAKAAEECSKRLINRKELDDVLIASSGLPAPELWLYAITLYRIVYEFNLRPLL
ncbi:hypothetical protein EU528_13835 [Candidatus Thorarchaeota archaeon]|nr:MAG: hypothetical protein EU528_13835 [Candidatus Thorarchaeota archaeon]